MNLGLPDAFFQVSFEILMINIWKMRLDLPGAFFKFPYQIHVENMHLDLPGACLQASLLNPYYKYMDNALGYSWCIP